MLASNIIRLTLCLSAVVTANRWSRQLPNAGQPQDNNGDWIPLTSQSDRSNNGRGLNYQPNQYSSDIFNAPLTDTTHQKRFSVGQPFRAQGYSPINKQLQQPLHDNEQRSLQQQHSPASQSFFKFEMPFFQRDGSRDEIIPTIQADYQIQHTLPQQGFATSPLFSQKPVFPPEFHPNLQPQYQPLQQQRPIHHNFVQDVQQQVKEKHLEHKPSIDSRENQSPGGHSAFQHEKYYDVPKPESFQEQLPFNMQPHPIHRNPGQEEVQLLYVPYDTLYHQRAEPPPFDANRFNLIPQPVNPYQINNFYTPDTLTDQEPNLSTSSTTSTQPPSSSKPPATTPRSFLSPQFTTARPTKRPKPHQPPLAMFMQKPHNKPSSTMDVVEALSSARAIAVLDAPSKSSPSVFVGPSGLPPPEGYTKFDLPYLSSLNRNNAEYLKDIPFFVAPLSYRPPTEFNKIVLPQPHVGSIVINKPLQKTYETNTLNQYRITERPQPQALSQMFVTPVTDSPNKFFSTTPTSRTTSQPGKHRYQFGTAYDVTANPSQSYSSTPKILPTKDINLPNEYLQQHYLTEVHPSSSPRPSEYFRDQYSQIPAQVTSSRPIDDGYYKQQINHELTPYRSSTTRPKHPFIQNEYDQDFFSFSTPKPALRAKEHFKNTYIPETNPTTSIRTPVSISHDTLSSTSEQSNLRKSQHSKDELYKEQYQTPSFSTSAKPTRGKERYGPLQYNKLQYDQDSESGDETPYIKEQLDSGNYFNKYNQEGRSSTSRTPITRSKGHDRSRHNNQRKPIQVSTQSTYGQFKPIPNSVINEEYYKVQPIKSSTISTTTSTTTTTTTTNVPAQTSDESAIQSNYGTVKTPIVDIRTNHDNDEHNAHNVQPSYYGNANNEEYQMKTYYRQQDAFKNRPNKHSTTTPAAIFESVQYTPISFDYDSQLYNVPSSTPSYQNEQNFRKDKPKEIVTYYAPTVQETEDSSPIPSTPKNNHVVEYTHDGNTLPSVQSTTLRSSKYSTTSSYSHPASSTERKRPTHKYKIPSNHRPSYNNEVTYNHEQKGQHEKDSDGEVEFDPNPYMLPSELPPLTPNLPGLVNALIEEDKENAIEKGATEIEESQPTTTTTFRPTRRPINRGRRPQLTRISSTTSHSSNTDVTTRRSTINRGRRPYSPRNNNNQTSTLGTTRTPLVRNPNRVRYNPTPEERRQYRQRTRVHSKKGNDEEDNLEYQRDVLKQNYPVFKPGGKSSTTAPTTKLTTTTEQPTEGQEQVVTVTPSSNKEQFSGLLEPLQIAQEYHQFTRQDNYGPGYFPNEEEAASTETLIEKNEIQELHPVFTTTTTETERDTTKRPYFLRRGSRPTRTTTESPSTTTRESEIKYTEKPTDRYSEKSTERYTVRPKVRPERPKVVKIRGRIRKPHPASTTTSSPNRKTGESGYHQLQKFNQDFFRDESPQVKVRRPAQYSLETQETQWSPSLSNANGFRPVDHEERSNVKFDNEPDIVTADPDGNLGHSDTFAFNVSAGFGSASGDTDVKNISEDKKTTTTESPFANLLEEVMSGVESTFKNQNETHFENAKKGKQNRRKGAWKRVRVSHSDALELAESQNIGSQLYNSIHSSGKEAGTKPLVTKTVENSTEPVQMNEPVHSTTALKVQEDGLSVTQAPKAVEGTTVDSEAELAQGDLTTTIPPEISEDFGKPSDYDMDGIGSATDSITRRADENDADDLETQSSIFDEVKKQLSSLFAADEPDDDLDATRPSFHPRKQEYTSIQRIRAVTENQNNKIKPTTDDKSETVTASPFHKNLMETVVYATSTSTEVSHETEICYRGRCIKTAKKL